LLGKREYEGREIEMDLLLEAVVDCIAVDCCYCVMLKGKERCQGDERFTGFQDPAMVALIPWYKWKQRERESRKTTLHIKIVYNERDTMLK
jgi:hypothetical protein